MDKIHPLVIWTSIDESNFHLEVFQLERVFSVKKSQQGGPLPIINGVTTSINGLK